LDRVADSDELLGSDGYCFLLHDRNSDCGASLATAAAPRDPSPFGIVSDHFDNPAHRQLAARLLRNKTASGGYFLVYRIVLEP
jgi:hypothetical protein